MTGVIFLSCLVLLSSRSGRMQFRKLLVEVQMLSKASEHMCACCSHFAETAIQEGHHTSPGGVRHVLKTLTWADLSTMSAQSSYSRSLCITRTTVAS